MCVPPQILLFDPINISGCIKLTLSFVSFSMRWSTLMRKVCNQLGLIIKRQQLYGLLCRSVGKIIPHPLSATASGWHSEWKSSVSVCEGVCLWPCWRCGSGSGLEQKGASLWMHVPRPNLSRNTHTPTPFCHAHEVVCIRYDNGWMNQ